MKARRTQPSAREHASKPGAAPERDSNRAVDDTDAASERIGDDSPKGIVLPAERPTSLRIPAANDAQDWPDVITVDELAALLRVDEKTVYAAIARGEIPGVRRIGRVLRASREAVLAWLREGRVSRSRRK